MEQARKDVKAFVQNTNDFGVELVFTNPLGVSITVVGIASRHHLAVDTDGSIINSRQAHFSVSEQSFIDKNYTIRNAKNDVDFEGHKVSIAQSSGTTYKYIIKQAFPDETIGLITCILSQTK